MVSNHDDGEVPDDGYVGGPMSGSRSGGVLVEGDVEHPVQCVLDRPMAAYGLSELKRGHRAPGNIEADLAALPLLFVDLRFDLDDGGYGREAVFAGEPVDLRGDCDPPLFDPAMALVDFGDLRGEVFRSIGKEGLNLAHQAGLVGLGCQQVIGARIEHRLGGFAIAG